MGKNMRKEIHDAYSKYFEGMSESDIRIGIDSERWRNDLPRLAAAKERIRQIDESRRKPIPKAWHERAWGNVIIRVIAGLILFAITFYVSKYLLSNKTQSPSNNHEKIQNRLEKK